MTTQRTPTKRAQLLADAITANGGAHPVNLEAVADDNTMPAYERKQRPRDRLWASQLGKCARSVWLSWRHPKPHDEAFERYRGPLGHSIEDLIAVRYHALIISREVSFTNHRVSGRCDFFLRLNKNAPQLPMEVKSTYAFNRMMNEPAAAHIAQACWYAQQDNAPSALLCYVNLSNYDGGSGRDGVLMLPRIDAALDAIVDMLWAVVQQPDGPECESPEMVDGQLDVCFDCRCEEGRA